VEDTLKGVYDDGLIKPLVCLKDSEISCDKVDTLFKAWTETDMR
jgi:hypothetical protein